MTVRACLGKSEFHYVMVGFDPLLKTYYAQVSELDLYGRREVLIWEGYNFRQITSIAALRKVLSPYVDLSEEQVLLLELDRAGGPPRLIPESPQR